MAEAMPLEGGARVPQRAIRAAGNIGSASASYVPCRKQASVSGCFFLDVSFLASGSLGVGRNTSAAFYTTRSGIVLPQRPRPFYPPSTRSRASHMAPVLTSDP